MITFKYDSFKIIEKKENEVLTYYETIINKYQDHFKHYGYSLNLHYYWLNTLKNKYSLERLPFKPGYRFYVCCKIEQKDYEHCKYFELSNVYEISSITGFCFFKKAKINNEIEIVSEDLENMLKLLENS